MKVSRKISSVAALMISTIAATTLSAQPAHAAIFEKICPGGVPRYRSGPVPG
jgi:hypothetical protein